MPNTADLSADILKRVQSAHSILLHLHPMPDADSVGSALAFYDYLQRMGKPVKVVLFKGELPAKYRFLKGSHEVTPQSFEEFNWRDFDLFITLDSGNIGQIANQPSLKIPLAIVNIDHHASNTNYGEINLVRPELSSTAEVLFWLFKEWEVQISKEIAEALYVGMWGDTGGFKFTNTKSSTLLAFAELVETGVDFPRISGLLTQLKKRELVALGKVLVSIQSYQDGKIIVSHYPRAAYNDLTEEEYINVREQARFIMSSSAEASVIAFIYTEDESAYAVSFRSNHLKYSVDTSQIARLLGGDGHARASAASVKAPTIEEAQQKVLEAINQIYPQLGD